MKYLKHIFESNWSEYDYNDAKEYLDLEFVDFLSPVEGINIATSKMDNYGYYTLIISCDKKEVDEFKEVLSTHIEQLKRKYPNIRGNIIEVSTQTHTQTCIIKLVLRNEEVRTPKILLKTDRYPVFGRR